MVGCFDHMSPDKAIAKRNVYLCPPSFFLVGWLDGRRDALNVVALFFLAGGVELRAPIRRFVLWPFNRTAASVCLRACVLVGLVGQRKCG